MGSRLQKLLKLLESEWQGVGPIRFLLLSCCCLCPGSTPAALLAIEA